MSLQTYTIHAKSITVIRGATGHGATPPVLKTGPHASTAADTDEVLYRPLLLFLCELSAAALAKWPSGTCSLDGFYTEFLITETLVDLFLRYMCTCTVFAVPPTLLHYYLS